MSGPSTTAPDATDRATFAAALNASGAAPSVIALIPRGSISGRDGRSFLNDKPEAVIAAFKAARLDLPIDLEHATELKAPKGEPAPAAGWIKQLALTDDAIVAHVEWTEDGARAVASRAYRYVSPAFLHERDSGRVIRLVSAGLTNRPNLALPSLNRTAETHVDLSSIAIALNLAREASEADIVTAIAALVPRAEFEAALNRANAAEASLAANAAAAHEAAIVAAVEAAVREGRIAPAGKPHYLALCRSEGGFEAFRKLVATLPRLTAPSALGAQRPSGSQIDDPQALAANAIRYRAEQARCGFALTIAEAVTAITENKS